MTRAATWILTGLAITFASVAVFVLAAWLFPGNPGRLYLVLSLTALTATLLLRLFAWPVGKPK